MRDAISLEQAVCQFQFPHSKPKSSVWTSTALWGELQMHFLYLEDKQACACHLESYSALQLPGKWVSGQVYGKTQGLDELPLETEPEVVLKGIVSKGWPMRVRVTNRKR